MTFVILRTEREIQIAYERLAAAPAIGCDTETSGLSPRTGRIFSVQFSDGEFSCLVPISEGVGLGRLEEILADSAVVKVFHNARFDVGFLREAGIETKNVFCTMIAEKVLTKGADQSASLAETLYRYFAIDLDKAPRSKFTKKWNGIWTEELVAYALADVAYLPRLMTEQRIWLGKLGLTEAFESQVLKALG